MNLEVFKHKKAGLTRQGARFGLGGKVHMLMVKENIALRQNPICKVSTGLSLRPAACNKEKRGGKVGANRLHSGGITGALCIC